MYSNEKDDLQFYLEQKDINKMTMSSSHSVLKHKSKENLVNALLIKESEVFALKEVIDKWRTRALEAESDKSYYCDRYLKTLEEKNVERFETMQAQYENEITAIEEEYIHRLNEKDDIIFGLRQELHYFAGKASQNDPLEDLMDEFDNLSTVESVYDRNVEQGFTLYSNDSTPSFQLKTKSEDILDSIQDTVNAIEQELRNHSNTLPAQHRRSLSASTLIETPCDEVCPKKMKKSSFYNVFKVLPKMLKRQTYHSLVKKSSCKDSNQTLNQLVDPLCPLTISNTTNKTLPV